MREARVKAFPSGLLAAAFAALLLRLKGYRILARRYRTPVGEIDIVALRDKRLVFVEVKRRKRAEEAAWSLPTQRRRIVRAAQYWLARHPAFNGHDISFDVVLTAPLVLARAHR